VKLLGILSCALLTLDGAQTGCVQIGGDRILVLHLTAALPELSGVPPDAVIGFAPKLGLSRWIEPSLIEKTAARYGQIVRVAESICVERSAAPLAENALRQALATALEKSGYTAYHLVLLDYPRSPLPSGDLDFALSGLTAARAGVTGASWRGRLRVEGGQSIPLSVRADVKVQVSELRAARNIAAGAIIAASDLSVVTRQAPPSSTPTSATASAAIGMQTRRGLKAGDLVDSRLLTAPPEVQRGERVLVAVTAGRAAVGVEAQADTTARRGQMVVLTNLASGKKFKATVTGRARAAILLESSNDDTMPDPAGPAAADGGPGLGGGETTAAAVRVGQNHR
jgi:flagella basal body P-ring formation protein FlgA